MKAATTYQRENALPDSHSVASLDDYLPLGLYELPDVLAMANAVVLMPFDVLLMDVISL